MNNYSHILVVLESRKNNTPIIEQAVNIALKLNASLTLYTVIYDFNFEMTHMLSSSLKEAIKEKSIQEKTDTLKEIVNELKRRYEVNIDFKVEWGNQLYYFVLEEIEKKDYSLLIKPTEQHHELKSIIFTPTDWHLMRKSNIPVFFLKDNTFANYHGIYICIDVSVEDQAHADLNHHMIEHGKLMATCFKQPLHLINCYPNSPINLSVEIPQFDMHEYQEEIEMVHKEKLKKLAIQYDIPIENCHVEEGLPDDVIPQFIQQHDAELVIAGTVGRTGLQAALIGNVAEMLIDSIPCALLSIKSKE